MKTITLYLLILLSISSVSFAQNKNQKGTVKLRGTRLTYPLVREWITAFNKEYPQIKVQIAPNAPTDSIDFNIAAYKLGGDELKDNKESATIARYVQLPIASSKRLGLSALQAKGLKEEDFKKIYFSSSSDKILLGKVPATIYTREKPVCATKSFAHHFGKIGEDVKGIGVQGDDQDLANAVKKDANGISYNNLGFIYNVKTRKIEEGLAIIPIDINENGKVDKDEQIYESLDKVVNFLERTNNKKFVIEPVNVIFDKGSKNTAAGLFLNWVITNGQRFNNQFGFLNLLKQQKTEEKAKIATSFKTASACEGSGQVGRSKRIKVKRVG